MDAGKFDARDQAPGQLRGLTQHSAEDPSNAQRFIPTCSAPREPHGRGRQGVGDPIRLQLVDVLRKHAGTVCVCDLSALVSSAFADVADLDSLAATVNDRAIAGAGFEPATFGL